MARKKPLPPSSIREYETSTQWKNKSKAILGDKECVCKICGRRRWAWQPRVKKWKRKLRFAVHHVTYENIPDEKDGDLLILCACCHEICHEILRMRGLGNGKMWGELAAVVEKYFLYTGNFKK